MEPNTDQVGLLDLLAMLVENCKLLLLGPALAGLVAFAISFVIPQKFVTEAILLVPTPTANSVQSAAQAAALMRSPLVLDQIIAALDLANGKSINIARREFDDNMKVTVGKDSLLRLELTGPSPARAQTLANAVIDTWIKTTKPNEQDRRDLETRLSYAKSSLEGVTALQARLSKSADYLAQPLSRGEAGNALISVSEMQSRYLNEVLSTTRALQGISRDVVVQSPTLPDQPAYPNRAQITGLAVLSASFALLLWVPARRSWQVLAARPQSQDKLTRLRAALKLK